MQEIEEYYPNDTTREIRSLIGRLRNWESDLADHRIKAMILSQLEIAELLSLRLVKEKD